MAFGVTLYVVEDGRESVMDDREEIFQIRQNLDRLYLTNILAHHLKIFLGFLMELQEWKYNS